MTCPATTTKATTAATSQQGLTLLAARRGCLSQSHSSLCVATVLSLRQGAAVKNHAC